MRLRRDARVFLEYKRDDFDEIATVIIVIPRVFEIRFKGEEKKERKKERERKRASADWIHCRANFPS